MFCCKSTALRVVCVEITTEISSFPSVCFRVVNSHVLGGKGK